MPWAIKARPLPRRPSRSRSLPPPPPQEGGGCAAAPTSAASWVAVALGIGCLRRRRHLGTSRRGIA
ncbi:MYXO-CTERM sorting domain-containing protein [Archangium gephyra]|uniref:MYXO-CTERM sorting domain-containing protein n=1 Tax=Archangium gephyra TaxID=48 RepID=UPI003B7E0BDE